MGRVEIVIADRDPALLQLLSRQLGEAGYDAVTCRDAESALNLVAERETVILLAGWEMPGLSGIEVCKRIRSWKPEKTAYVILLTHSANPARITVGLEAGADDYLIDSAQASESCVSWRIRGVPNANCERHTPRPSSFCRPFLRF
jgi:two-component system phosphate regulon response regulator PhoB